MTNHPISPISVHLEDLPAVLTIEEAASVLRIGRSAAYELARQWRTSNGASGLPVIELGRTLRVPRHALLALIAEPGHLAVASIPRTA